MDTEELRDASPEELDKQYLQPSYKGKDAGDNKKSGLGAGSKPNYVGQLGKGGAAGAAKDKAMGAVQDKAIGAAASAAGVPAPVAGLLAKNKKKLLYGALGVVGLIVVVIALLIAFFLSLFKLKDIEKMFLSYEFAATTRTVAERTQEILDEAQQGDISQPTGTADTPPAGETDPLEKQFDSADAKEIKTAETDPTAEAQLADRAEVQLDLTPEGSFGRIASNYNTSESDPTAGEDDSDQATADKNVDQAVQKQVTQSEAADGAPTGDAADSVDDGVKAADSEAAAGTPIPEALADAVSKPVGNFFTQATGMYALVVYCVAYETFHQGAQKIATAISSGLMQFAVSTFGAADRQTEGGSSENGYKIGAYNQLFDHSGTGDPSFTQSAAYSRANHQTPAPATDLDAASLPFTPTENTIVAGVFNYAAGHGIPGALSDTVCPIVLNPYILGPVAGAFLIANIVGIITTGGAADAGPDAAVGAAAAAAEEAANVGAETAVDGAITNALDTGIQKSVSQQIAEMLGKTIAKTAIIGVGFYAAGDGLKYLVNREIAHVSGLAVADNSDPVQNADKLDAGTDLMAQESAKEHGGRLLTAGEATQLKTVAYAQQAQKLSRQSLAYRLFSPSNQYSLTAQIALRTPSQPGEVLAASASYFASLFNPNKLITTFANLLPIGTASADVASTGDPYGIPQYGLTDAEVNKWSFKDNSAWVEQNISAQDQQKYDACFDTRLTDLNTGSDIQGMCTSTTDVALQHYRIYRLDKRIVQNLVDYGNNTSKSNAGTPTTTASSASNAVAGPIYFVGDSILERLSNGGLATSLAAKGFQPATLDFSVSRSINGPGIDNNKLSGLDAIAADAASISAAKTIVVELGTNEGDSSDINTFNVEVGEVYGKLRALNPTAPIEWVNMVSTSNPNYPARNAALVQDATTLGFGVIDARAGNIQLDPDGIHPSIPTGVTTMRDLIVNTLQP